MLLSDRAGKKDLIVLSLLRMIAHTVRLTAVKFFSRHAKESQ